MNKQKPSHLIFVFYLTFVLWYTLVGRDKSAGINMLSQPFWEYIAFIKNPCWSTAHDIVLNIVLFMPFGFFVTMIFDINLKKTVILALKFSVCIELSQLIFERGYCEIDDMFNNATGALIGYMIYMKIWKKAIK